MTQTYQFVCASCPERGMFVTLYHTIRAAGMHIGKSSVCWAFGMGVKEVELETLRTEAMVGGTGAAGPAPDLQHQPPCPRSFRKQKVWIA